MEYILTEHTLVQFKDSYSLGYQIKGTAHFCKTFATMIYLNLNNVGKYKLTPGKYVENIYIAFQFWIDILEDPSNSELTNYIYIRLNT